MSMSPALYAKSAQRKAREFTALSLVTILNSYFPNPPIHFPQSVILSGGEAISEFFQQMTRTKVEGPRCHKGKVPQRQTTRLIAAMFRGSHGRCIRSGSASHESFSIVIVLGQAKQVLRLRLELCTGKTHFLSRLR